MALIDGSGSAMLKPGEQLGFEGASCKVLSNTLVAVAQLVMITGDTPLTACHAASRIHILDRPVLIAVHRCRPPPVGNARFAACLSRVGCAVARVYWSSLHVEGLRICTLNAAYIACVFASAVERWCGLLVLTHRLQVLMCSHRTSEADTKLRSDE